MADDDEGGFANVRASRYFIVEGRMLCLNCHEVSAVFAFALPEGYESFFPDDDSDDEESGSWEATGVSCVLDHVEWLSTGAVKRIHDLTSNYRFNEGAGYWMSYCQHCGAEVEEEEMCEIEGPFGQLPYEGPDSIQLREVREPFEALAGGESEEPHFLDGK